MIKSGGPQEEQGAKQLCIMFLCMFPKSLPSPSCTCRAQGCYLSKKHTCKISSIILLLFVDRPPRGLQMKGESGLSQSQTTGLSTHPWQEAHAPFSPSASLLGIRQHEQLHNQEFRSRKDLLEQSQDSVCGSCRDGVMKAHERDLIAHH